MVDWDILLIDWVEPDEDLGPCPLTLRRRTAERADGVRWSEKSQVTLATRLEAWALRLRA